MTHPAEQIPHMSRDRAYAQLGARAYGPGPRRRPVAHVLTYLGNAESEPTYQFECRALAGDFDKRCAMRTICECDERLGPARAPDTCPTSPTGRHKLRDGFLWHPVRGCSLSYADADGDEALDRAVKHVIAEQRLVRGVYLVNAAWTIGVDEVELELLATIGTVGGAPSPEALPVRPTEVSRRPGFGPEVDLRELIEASFCETDGSVNWDDDECTIIIDAQEPARQVIAWIENNYDIPPDQLSFPTPTTVTVPAIGGVL